MLFTFSILENWTCCQIHQGMEFDLKGLNKISTEYANARKLAIEGTFLYASCSHLDYKNSVIKVQIYFICFLIIPNFIKDHWSIEKKKQPSYYQVLLIFIILEKWISRSKISLSNHHSSWLLLVNSSSQFPEKLFLRQCKAWQQERGIEFSQKILCISLNQGDLI